MSKFGRVQLITSRRNFRCWRSWCEWSHFLRETFSISLCLPSTYEPPRPIQLLSGTQGRDGMIGGPCMSDRRRKGGREGTCFDGDYFLSSVLASCIQHYQISLAIKRNYLPVIDMVEIRKYRGAQKVSTIQARSGRKV